jgi:hypothetical protein
VRWKIALQGRRLVDVRGEEVEAEIALSWEMLVEPGMLVMDSKGRVG